MYPYAYSKYNIVFSKFALYSLIGSFFSLLVTFDELTKTYRQQSFFEIVFNNAQNFAISKINSMQDITAQILDLPLIFQVLKLMVIPLKLLKLHNGFFTYTTFVLDLVSFFSLFNTGLINKSNVLNRAEISVNSYFRQFRLNPSLVSAFVFTLKGLIEESIEIVKDLSNVQFLEILDIIQFDSNYVVRLKQLVYVLPLFILRQLASLVFVEIKDAAMFFISVTLPALLDLVLDFRTGLINLIVGDVKLSDLIQYTFSGILEVFGTPIRQVLFKGISLFFSLVSIVTKVIFGKGVSPKLIFDIFLNAAKIIKKSCMKLVEGFFTFETGVKITANAVKMIPISAFFQVIFSLIFLAIVHLFISLLAGSLKLLQFINNYDVLSETALNLESPTQIQPDHVVTQIFKLFDVLDALPLEIFVTEQIFDSVKNTTTPFVSNYVVPGTISNPVIMQTNYKVAIQKLILLNYLNRNVADAKLLYEFYLSYLLSVVHYPPLLVYSATKSGSSKYIMFAQIENLLSGLSAKNKRIVLLNLRTAISTVQNIVVSNNYILPDRTVSHDTKLKEVSPNSCSAFMSVLSNYQIKTDPAGQFIPLFSSLDMLINLDELNSTSYSDKPDSGLYDLINAIVTPFKYDLINAIVTPFNLIRLKLFTILLVPLVDNLKLLFKGIFLRASGVKFAITNIPDSNITENKLNLFSAMWTTISRLYLTGLILQLVQTYLLRDYATASLILFSYRVFVIYSANAPFMLLTQAVHNISFRFISPFILWVFLELTYNFILVYDTPWLIQWATYGLSWFIYGLPTFWGPVGVAAYVALQAITGASPSTISKYAPAIALATGSLFIVAIPAIMLLISLLLLYTLTTKSTYLAGFLLKSLEFILDNVIVPVLDSVGLNWIKAFKFFNNFINPFTITWNLLSIAYTGLSGIRVKAFKYTGNAFSSAYRLAKLPFIVYYDLIMSNYEVIIILFLIKKLIFGTYNKSALNRITVSIIYNIFGLRSIAIVVFRTLAYWFNASPDSFKNTLSLIKVKLQKKKSMAEIQQSLESNRFGLFSFGCEIKNLPARAAPDKSKLWVKNLEQQMASFNAKAIIELMTIYDSYAGYILRQYIELHILKVEDQKSKLDYLFELFNEVLNNPFLMNYNYKLILFIIHKYELVINKSKDFIKNKDQYYNNLLTSLIKFEKEQYNYAWYSPNKLKYAALIVSVCELMIFSLSKTLKPDQIAYISSGTIPVYISKRYCDHVYLYDLGTRVIVKIPITKSKYTINQYVDIKTKDINLQLSTYPFNSLKLRYLLVKDEQQFVSLDNLLEQNPNYYIDLLYKHSVEITSIVVGFLLSQKLTSIRNLQVELDELYEYVIRLQQKTVESNLSLDVSAEFENLAKFINTKRDVIAENSKLDLESQEQNFHRLISLNDKLSLLLELIYSQIYEIDKELYFVALRIKPLIIDDAYLAQTRAGFFKFNKQIFFILYKLFVKRPITIFYYLDIICSDNFNNELNEDFKGTLNESYLLFALTVDNLMGKCYSEILSQRLNLIKHKSYAYFEEDIEISTQEMTELYPHYKLNRSWQTALENLELFNLSSRI